MKMTKYCTNRDEKHVITILRTVRELPDNDWARREYVDLSERSMGNSAVINDQAAALKDDS